MWLFMIYRVSIAVLMGCTQSSSWHIITAQSQHDSSPVSPGFFDFRRKKILLGRKQCCVPLTLCALYAKDNGEENLIKISEGDLLTYLLMIYSCYC